MHYVAVIDKDPDSAYGVRFPEVPGCFSAADTFGEIVPNSIEALSLFFEDTEPAPPRGLESVREQVADDIANGSVLMMIPYATASSPRLRAPRSDVPRASWLPRCSGAVAGQGQVHAVVAVLL